MFVVRFVFAHLYSATSTTTNNEYSIVMDYSGFIIQYQKGKH